MLHFESLNDFRYKGHRSICAVILSRVKFKIDSRSNKKSDNKYDYIIKFNGDYKKIYR